MSVSVCKDIDPGSNVLKNRLQNVEFLTYSRVLMCTCFLYISKIR